jgi:hypothetical protein
MFGGFNFPSQFGGVSYPQFNMGMNPYSGMFSGFGGFNPYMQSYQMQQPMMQSPMGSFGENNYLSAPEISFTPSPFAQGLFRSMYNMPFSPMMNFAGGLGLREYNRGSLQQGISAVRDSSGNDQQGGVSNPGGVTDSYSGGRDADGWGE